MTSTSQIEEMKRYLFYEMSAEESDALEERFFEDSEYFYDLCELENDLIDSYAVENLKGDDLKRFEKSLEKSPERREKIANARALQTLITEENRKPVAIAAAPTFWEKISSFFTLQMSAIKLAAGALAILLICSAAFLLYRNWQARNEFADIERQKQKRIELEENENLLQKEKEELKRIQDERLKNEINNPIDNSNINLEQDSNRQNRENELRQRMEEREKKIEQDRKKLIVPLSPQNEVKPRKEVLAFNLKVIPLTRADFLPIAELKTINNEKFINLTLPINELRDYEEIELVGKGKYSNKSFGKSLISKETKSLVFRLPPDAQGIEINGKLRGDFRGLALIGDFGWELPKDKK